MTNQFSIQQSPIAKTPTTGKGANAALVKEAGQGDQKFSGLMKNLNAESNANESGAQNKETSNTANSIVPQKDITTKKHGTQNTEKLNDKDLIEIIKMATAPKNDNEIEKKTSGKNETIDQDIDIAATLVSADEIQFSRETQKLPQQGQVADVTKSTLVLPQSVQVAVKDGLKAVQPVSAQEQSKEVRVKKIAQNLQDDQIKNIDQTLGIKSKSVDVLPGTITPEPARNKLVKDLNPSIKDQPVPSEKITQLKAETKIETVTVVESTKVKYFPVDVENQAWKQIGQKITQSLTSSQPLKDVETSLSTPLLDQSDDAVSKTVKHLKVQLKPENLGTVDVKLTMTNGTMEVMLLASDKALASRLQQQSEHLSRQLKSAGFSFEHLSVQFADVETPATTRTFSNQGNDGSGQGSTGQRQSQSGNSSFGQDAEQGSQNNQDRNTQYAQREENAPFVDGSDRSDGSIRL